MILPHYLSVPSAPTQDGQECGIVGEREREVERKRGREREGERERERRKKGETNSPLAEVGGTQLCAV